jgi:hypothetical protein
VYRLLVLDVIAQPQPSILHYKGEWPEGFAAGPTEDPEDENIDMAPAANLPWPKSEAIHTWRKRHQGQFRPGTRYLLGKPSA